MRRFYYSPYYLLEFYCLFELISSNNLIYEFGELNLIIFYIFLIDLFFIKLSQFYNSNHEFNLLTPITF